MTLRAVKD